MKRFFLIAAFFVSLGAVAQMPQQIAISMDRQDFQPIKQANWKIMAGTSSLNVTEGQTSHSGSGLGVGIERALTDRWSMGAHYANVRSLSSDSSFTLTDSNGNWIAHEYRQSINMFDIYGRFDFVNFPVNRWNLIQVSLLGGGISVDRDKTQLIYGMAVSYNYDNLLGFELNTKVNWDAEASTSANLIGYF